MKLYRQRDYQSGIYLIRNKVNNKIYIGKAKNIYERIRQHINLLNKKSKDENIHLINSWHKYGRENFEYEVLEYCSIDLLEEKELLYIKQFNSLDRNIGYNMRLDTSTKCILPEETRKRMSESKKKLYADPNYDNMKHSHTYWKDNPEAKKEMAKKVSEKTTKYKIEQYDKEMNLIKIWDSVKAITTEHPNFKWQQIYSVCNGYKKSIYGYVWKKVKI